MKSATTVKKRLKTVKESKPAPTNLSLQPPFDQSATNGWSERIIPFSVAAETRLVGQVANAQGVIDAFAQASVDLPVDYEHQSDKPGVAMAGPVPAAGWIKELKADALGLWGRVEWTAQARELIAPVNVAA